MKIERIFISEDKCVLMYKGKQVELVALPTENGEKRLYAKTFFPKETEGYEVPQYKSNPDKCEDIEGEFVVENGISIKGESSEDGYSWWIDFPEGVASQSEKTEQGD